MKLEWETRYRWAPPENLETRYLALTKKVGMTLGVHTGYLVLWSKRHRGKYIAAQPDGTIRVFDTEEEAKDYCEVCCRMEIHHARGTSHR